MQFLTLKNYQGVGMYKFGHSPLGLPFLSVYCYQLDDVLIDTAQLNCKQRVLQTFENKNVNTIILTHWHEGHTRNVATLSANHNAKVLAPKGTITYLRNDFNILSYEHFLFGEIQPYFGNIDVVEGKISIKNCELAPVFTPEHSADHTAYIEQNKGWLFAGDLFAGVRIKVFKRSENFWQQLASFKKIMSYGFDMIFYGHHPRLSNGKAWMQQKIIY